MQKIYRRLLSMALILALVLSLTACGQNTGQTVGSGAADNPAQSGNTASNTSLRTDEDTVYNGLFDTSRVHTVSVTLSDEDWEDLRANATSKTKYHAAVVIDGETVEDVSFATKGNTSLSFVASDPDSDRYSFKINFGKYDKDQTYHGLNKLNLNNIYADATYMKDFLSYELFRQVGVDAPLVSYVWLTINGNDHGLYLAIEDVSEGWLDRTNDGEGELYKPETEMLDNIGQAPQGGNGEQPSMPGGQGFPGGEAGENGQGGFPGFPGGDGTMPTPPDGQATGNGQQATGESGQGGFPGGDGTMPTTTDGSSSATPQNGDQEGSSGFPGGNGTMPTPPDGSSFPGFPGGGQTPPDWGGQTPPDGQATGENGQSGFPGGNGQGGFPGGMGGFGGSSSGADLVYRDDDPESYSDIFNNDETDADEAAQQRVITALKALSEGTDLETYLNTDEIIRYFAAHDFTLNYDSYTGSMLHNYYLYEKDGQLSMLPWDYNLAYGGFGGGSNATELINTGIDSPLNGSSEESRPMWAWIAADEDYTDQYHKVYDELLSKYFESGDFSSEFDALYALLRPYVENDPSAFYTLEEFDTAAATLKQFCLLRAESIRAQLNGTLATKTSEQNTADRIDASSVNISSMGSHGGGQGGIPGGHGRGKRT